MDEILNQIRPIIAEKLGVDPSEVTMEASFTNDLGADSLDIVELMMEFEKECGLLKIPYDKQEELVTVGDVVGLVANMRADEPLPVSKKPARKSAPPKKLVAGKQSTVRANVPAQKSSNPDARKHVGDKVIFSGNILEEKVEYLLNMPEFNDMSVVDVLHSVPGNEAIYMSASDFFRCAIEQYNQKRK